MSPAARIYISAVTVSGAALLWLVFPQNITNLPILGMVVLFTLCIVLADLNPVRLPWDAVVSVSTALNFANTLIFGVGWACWAAAFAVIVADTYHKRPWYKVAFNAAGTVIWTGLAGLAYTALYDGNAFPLHSLNNVSAVAAYALVQFTVNTLLVSLVISFTQHIKPWQIWLVNFRSVSLQFATQIPLGVLIVTAYWQSERWGVLLLALPLVMVYYSIRTSQQLRQQTISTIETLADVVDKRDPYTFEHSSIVSQYAEKIARRLNLSLQDISTIILAARVHDLGKIGVSDSILLKPGKLDPEERAIMQEHPAIGADLVSQLTLYQKGRELILYHHERFDGQGYPTKIKGEAIPLGARILAVADSFQAMTSDRPYRKAMPLSSAIAELRAGRGTQFDPTVVDAFISILEEDASLSPRQGAPVPVAKAEPTA